VHLKKSNQEGSGKKKKKRELIIFTFSARGTGKKGGVVKEGDKRE